MNHGSLSSEASLPPAARRAGAVFLACGAVLWALAIVVAVPGMQRMLGQPAWLEAVPFVAAGPAAISCLMRAAATRAERLPWALIGAGQLLYCVGYTYTVFAPEVAAHATWNWIIWFSWYPGLAVALIALLRARVARVPRSLWLDGVMVGCAGTAVYTALLIERFLHAAVTGELAEEGISFGIAVAYPLGDLVLLALVICILAVHGWRLPRGWNWLVVPLLATTVADGAELSGLISTGVAVLVWPPFGLMMAYAAWQPIERLDRVKVIGRSMFIAPLCCSVLVLAVLLYGTVSGFTLAVVLAASAFVALIVRVWLLLDDIRRATVALEQAHAEADRLARTDPLTGTANRRAFGEALTGACADEGGTGVLLIDIDHFKIINDRYGHDAGDRVIVEVTRRISAAVRRSDVVGRWGGEEFCVLLHSVPGEDPVKTVAETVRNAVCAQPVALAGDLLVEVTVSVGAIFLGYGSTLTVVMNAADEQLYAAKRGGRNQVRSGVHLVAPNAVVAAPM